MNLAGYSETDPVTDAVGIQSRKFGLVNERKEDYLHLLIAF